MDDTALRRLMQAIASDDEPAAAALLAASPDLARAALSEGATRAAPAAGFVGEIQHHVYAGDTALHVAAAAHRPGIILRLIGLGADVSATNRRGATPLHYATDGVPGSPRWDPTAQAEAVRILIASGGDPNVADKNGVTPLHRAIRTRSAAAVAALLEGGADPSRPNGNGSTCMMLATRQTGRGGSGSPDAKAQQTEIVRLLEACGAAS